MRQWGVPNYLPPRASGEDDTSIERLQSMLEREYMKVKSQRSYPKIDHAMEQTFPERRRLLIKEGVSVATIKEFYPILFDIDEVK